ncbi:MAG: His-Xaa-Ser system radical SAM maturase HxsB [Acidaminococcaceae bacterium]|nr:His-Xaa-Ser system radical SAM maturase HxsB [Acidaminococcaceae bacterium]
MKLLPFDFERLDLDNVLLTNIAGEAILLTSKEFEILCNEDYDWLPELSVNELAAKHFIANDDSLDLSINLLANKLRSRKDYLSGFTSLHMVVLTLRCNCMCSYCHASSKGGISDHAYDMDEFTARNTVNMIFKSPAPVIKIEFQGGEPTLNFDILKVIVLYAEELNTTACKELSFVICTNLLSLSDEQLDFLHKHKVDISTSCDGTKSMHDYCRKSLVSDSAYESFINNLEKCRNIYGRDNGPSALLTVTRNNLGRLREIIDHYRFLGFNNMFIRALNPYGYALDNKNNLDYSVDEFVKAYKDALAYIIDLNIKGIFFVESYAALLLQRILTPFSTGFVDLQSPSGAGILGCIYNFNGEVYPADEGRMLAARGDKTFLMGNVNNNSYEDIFHGKLIQKLVKNSCVECMPGCSYCAYKNYCGSDPIRYYVECNDIVGKRYSSGFCKKNKAIIKELLHYLIKKDSATMKVFWSWINRKPLEVCDDNK